GALPAFEVVETGANELAPAVPAEGDADEPWLPEVAGDALAAASWAALTPPAWAAWAIDAGLIACTSPAVSPPPSVAATDGAWAAEGTPSAPATWLGVSPAFVTAWPIWAGVIPRSWAASIPSRCARWAETAGGSPLSDA